MARPSLLLTTATAALLLALGCAGTGRCASTPAPSPAPSVDPSAVDGARADGTLPDLSDPTTATDADMDALVRFLVPHVEAAGGARFQTVPAGRLGTPEVLADILERETLDILGGIYEVPEPVLKRMAASARAGVPGLLGKYATSTGAVYLVPDNVAQAAASREGASTEDVALLIMAHELGHALQDQVADLDAGFGGLQDLDHFDAMRGVTEGQANWITLRVARALDREEAFWALAKGQGWGRDGLEQPGAFPVWMLYGQGLAFSEHHAAEGGTDRLWALVRTPPRSTTMLFRPERVGQDVPRPPWIVGALDGVEQRLTRVDWVVADTLLGEAPLRRETIGLPAERVDEVLGDIGWGHERRLSWPGGEGYSAREASILVVHFDTPEAARALVDLLSDGLEAQAAARTAMEAELAEKLPGVVARTWTVETVPYDRVQGDAVLRRVVGPTSDSGARLSASEEQALWVVRGAELVVVQVSGFRPGNRLDKAVEAIFEALDTARAADAPEPD